MSRPASESPLASATATLRPPRKDGAIFGRRSGLGALNTGGIDEVVRFTLYDAAGHALGSTDRTVGALGVVQFSVEAITTAPITGGRVEVEVVTSNGHALAWASVIDNATGDPIFVPAQ